MKKAAGKMMEQITFVRVRNCFCIVHSPFCF
jgi:hypothetical protein